ncbi:MAG: carboxyl transferase domain-containing protein [Dehalococcoidia bacterium]
MADENGWVPLLNNLERRKAAARAMGGTEKVARHNEVRGLDARGRIDRLLDRGSFQEIGTLVGGIPRGTQPAVPADALVTGMGQIDGRSVLVGSEDFTVSGGSIGLGTHAKRVRLAALAAQERVPLIMLLEGAGERVTNSMERYPYAPNDLQVLAGLSGMVPTVTVVMGASAGHGALTAMFSDFVIMVEDSAIFSAGPPLVAAATGEQVTKDELGGPDVHVRMSGLAHNPAATDEEALKLVRRYLSYLPSSAWQLPPCISSGEEGERRLDKVLELIPPDPRKAYDVRNLVDMLCDSESVMEIQPHFGASIVTSFARIGGRPVAIVANQPLVMMGSIDSDAANKAAHFLEVADAFHLPVVFLTDNPGIMAGTEAEQSGALRCAARMFSAQYRVRSPKLHVTVRKAYGFGSSLMAMNPFDHQTLTLAFPSATLGAMPAQGGGSAAHADSDTQLALDAAELGGAWAAADTMNYDEVIDPRDLRNVLLSALRLTSGRETERIEPRPGGIRP